MAAPRARTIMFGTMGIVLIAFLVLAFRPEPIAIDAGTVTRGPMQMTIADDGRTRVKELYVVSAPIAGRVLRLEPEVGDKVVAGETLLATMLPSGPAFLDERRQKEAEAAVEAAKAALELAKSDVARVEAEVDYAKSEIKRTEALVASDTASPAALDKARLAFRTASAQLETARSSVRVRQADLAVAEAALIGPDQVNENGSGVVEIRAPITGSVLTLVHESEGVVSIGTPLLELGNPEEIEIVADFLSHQAVQVKPGARVMIEGWGGETLEGHVRLVEPKGFTKYSALGIEEQRVNIIIDFDGLNGTDLGQLGHGFRVEPRIVLWEEDNILQVPTSALFRKGDGWAVFKIEDETAILVPLNVGKMNDTSAQILGGLAEGDVVVLHPSDNLEDDIAVRVRSQ